MQRTRVAKIIFKKSKIENPQYLILRHIKNLQQSTQCCIGIKIDFLKRIESSGIKSHIYSQLIYDKTIKAIQ